MLDLAIVIPYYKLDFFEHTLTSLDNQTNKNFRVYIGNDASPDDPQEIINKYNEGLQITYNVFEENLGLINLTGQWDRCIDLIEDESWLMILGDDDFLGPEVVSRFYSELDSIESQSNVVRYASKILYEDNSESIKFEHPKLEKAKDSYLRRYYGETRSSLSEYIFKRKSYEKFGFYEFPLAWHSDDRAWLEFSDGRPIYTINDATVYFRHSRIHITGKEDNLEAKDNANLEFYKFLSKQVYFSKEHRLLFARNYERTSKKIGKLNLRVWLQLIYIYILSFEIESFRKLLKRIIRQYI